MASRRRWDLGKISFRPPGRDSGVLVGMAENNGMGTLMAERPRWWCHVLAATFSTVFVAVPAVMLFDRRDPITIEKISITPEHARSGEIITMRWRAIVNRPGCDGVVIRRYIGILDHVIRETVGQPVVFRGKAGDRVQEFETQFNIPISLAPGEYIYEPVVKRWCNPVQHLLWPIVSYQSPVRFTVVPH